MSHVETSVKTIVGSDTSCVEEEKWDFGFSLNAGVYFLLANDFTFDAGVRYIYLPLKNGFNNYSNGNTPNLINGLVFRFKSGFFFG